MAGLQRSSVSFRRQGSSGLIWEDRFLSGELNQKKQKEEGEEEIGGLRHCQSVGNIGMMERNRSGEGRAWHTVKVSPPIEPPSPKVSGCGICGIFGKPASTKRPRSRIVRKLNLSTNALSGQIPSTSFSALVFANGTIGGGGGGCFDDELPLLEELGINTCQIWRKTASILNPLRVNPDLHEDADLSGPFIFLMAFGFFQLLAGKLHFGIILGWAATFLYVVFNMLAGRNGNLDLYRCLSLVGYCMLPMVIFSALRCLPLKVG